MTYQIICDSCTDLPENMLRDPHVSKVALSIHIGPDTIIDDESFDQLGLLKKMREWSDAPKTACPSPHAYMEKFRDDRDNYIVTLSARLSGSYNAAVQAAELYREEGGRGNVHVFNSKSATAGQAQVAMLIRDLAEKELPFEQIVKQVEEQINGMQTLFVLENLDNLKKNGRLTRMQSLVTGALRVKLLMGATRDGEIEKLGQGLSIWQTLGRMVSYMTKNVGSMGSRLVISHCNCLDRAEYVRDLAVQKKLFEEIVIVATGGIATVYANDGGIVVAY